MPLITCSECGHSVSTQATACPSCGVALAQTAQKGGNGLIAAGYICAILALLFPGPLGISGVAIGFINLTKGRIGHGIAQIALAVFCGLIGFAFGMALLYSTKP